VSGIVKPILLPAGIGGWCSIASTISAGSSIVLTLTDAEYTVFVLLMMDGGTA
jgi:hypothetical protein